MLLFYLLSPTLTIRQSLIKILFWEISQHFTFPKSQLFPCVIPEKPLPF